jgi:GAF domain-containing protein
VQREPEWHGIYLPGRDDTRSELAVPIFHRGSREVVGIINLESHRHAAFTKDDLRLLEDLAIIADLALNNALHYQELEEQKEKLAALYKSAQIISEAGLEIETVLQVILNQAIDVTKAQFGTMQIIDNNDLVFKAAWPIGEKASLQDKIGRMPIDGKGITARAVLQRKAQLVPDVSKDDDFVSGIFESGCELAVVLWHDNKSIGVLNVEHSEPFKLDDGDRELLEGLADLAVIALQNAEQYRELERVKNTLQASQAVAWLGIFGADWKHTIHQRTFSLSNDINGLRQLLGQVSAPVSLITQGFQALERVEETVIDIRSVTNDRLYTDAEDQYNAQIDDTVRQHIELSRGRNPWIEVCLDLRCSGVRATITRDQLNIALEKLVNNAFKKMPNGGKLSITTRSVGHTIQISIRDTGPGIPEQIREDFLKRPIQKPNGANGTGTGVLIASFIAQVNGGNLTWHPNANGRGIEVILTLPSISAEQLQALTS